ncbi:MAG: HD domain-containing protein [Eubacteriaceae bacterium]|jgi:3'-5' exoribonuclease|nr:HD domain-containing protein [Eubacteriaceae bacterium]
MLIDLKVGQNFTAVVLIDKIVKKTASNNKTYVDLVVKDRSAVINGKIWNGDQVDMELFQPGKVAKIGGKVDEYNGKMQIIVESMTLIESPDKEVIEALYASAPMDAAEMYEQIYTAAAKIEIEALREIVCGILADYKERLLIFPGAKQMHHAYRSGLLYHTHTILRHARAVVDIYPYLNKDLLYAAVILHDIGKLEEIALNEYGIPVEYSQEGKLLGHIIQGICMIDKKAQQLQLEKSEATMALKHCLLSHHYFAEYGSPKMPMIAEAEVLYYLDVMDARMFQMEEALSLVQNGEFTQRIYALENRSLYKFGEGK